MGEMLKYEIHGPVISVMDQLWSSQSYIMVALGLPVSPYVKNVFKVKELHEVNDELNIMMMMMMMINVFS